jgi:hypothetical protein
MNGWDVIGRRRPVYLVPVLLVAVCALMVGVAPREAWVQGPVIPFKDARIKFEVNATDRDGGIQLFVDADGWEWLHIYDPHGREIFEARARGRIAKQGATELFLESAEPEFTELPLAQLLERFPEGSYRFRARGLDGEQMEGVATLTHDIPDGPRLVSPLTGGDLQDPDRTVLVWEGVAAPNGSPIIAYQVLVVQPNTGLPALPKVTLDVMMQPTARSLAVPPGFLRPDTEYEWEVLAIEAGGNQTLSSSTFRTAP